MLENNNLHWSMFYELYVAHYRHLALWLLEFDSILITIQSTLYFFTSSFFKVTNTLRNELAMKEVLVEELKALNQILTIKEWDADNGL